MKSLVVYDTVFGNTEKVARAIGEALGQGGEVEVLKVTEVKPEKLAGLDLLVVGSPTRGFRPTKGTNAFLNGIPQGSLKGVKVAAFDTRIALEDTKSGVLKFMVGIFGYAAKPIANKLESKGGSIKAPPEGFYVTSAEVPEVKEGELGRAGAWARDMLRML